MAADKIKRDKVEFPKESQSTSSSFSREGNYGLPTPRKIAIIGSECTGKTELAQALAEHFGTEWVPEYARTFIDHLITAYHQEDLLTIAKGQLGSEDRLMKKASKYLFCDTNLVVIKIWSDHRYGDTHQWILDSLNTRKYDFYLLADIDIPWEPDPQREHPHMRQYFFDQYQNYLIENKQPFAVVNGLGDQRMQQAIKLMEERLS